MIDKKHIKYIITKLSFTCLAITVVMPLITKRYFKSNLLYTFPLQCLIGLFLK